MANLTAAKLVMITIYETVAEFPEEGCLISPVYLALAEHGCTRNQFDNMVLSLILVGVIRREGHRLFTVPSVARKLGLIRDETPNPEHSNP